MEGDKAEGAEIERLPVDLLAHILALLSSFCDLAQASGVCRRWREAARRSLARRERLSFAGYKMDDDSTARLVRYAYNLRDLDISRSCWGCQITDNGLCKISLAKCIGNLTSISLWGVAGITDKGVIQLVTKARSLRHLNIGGTFITDDSLSAIANSCPHLKLKRYFVHWIAFAGACFASSTLRTVWGTFEKTIVLWCCRHVTGAGLQMLVGNCRKLESINVWGMRVPMDCFLGLLAISPVLQLKPVSLHLNIGGTWPVL